MMRKTIPFPWRGQGVPHGTLNISSGCNIQCERCYNPLNEFHFKSVDEIRCDLEQLLACRRLHTITISGGEPTLHPKIVEIVTLLHAHRLKVILCSNALALDESLVTQLAKAGLDLVLMHIQTHQQRSDLPDPADSAAVGKLALSKAELLHKYNIESGLAFTLEKDNVEHFVDLMQKAMDSPYLNYALVTTTRDFESLGTVEGNIRDGFTVPFTPTTKQTEQLQAHSINTDDFEKLMMERLGLLPFSHLGWSNNKAGRAWLNYQIAAVTHPKKPTHVADLKPSFLERTVLGLIGLFKLRFPLFVKPSGLLYGLQLLLNGLTGGRFLSNAKLLLHSLAPSSRLIDKHIIYQNICYLDDDGSVVICEHCPDATYQDGQLIPICLLGRVSPQKDPT